jgi:hypothetical protein
MWFGRAVVYKVWKRVHRMKSVDRRKSVVWRSG